MKSIKAALLCVLMLALATTVVRAQTSASRITGTVTDSSGALISGAKVTVTQESTNISFTAETTAAGLYVFDGLQPGKYTVKIEHSGFRTVVAAGNVLSVGTPLTVNLRMEVGGAQEVVEVKDAGEVVQTSTSGNFGNTLTNETLAALPLGLDAGAGGRNVLTFTRLQPGVNHGSNTGGGQHINGARDRAINYTLDGIDINEGSAGGSEFSPIRTNPDSLAEFRVITSNATAEYGRNSGAQVQLVTKSGTNNLHGNIFYFHRNSALAANEWSANFSGAKKPLLIQHQFGGSIGGPIIRDKTFFFFNYQGQKQQIPVTVNRTVFTPTARSGIFRWVAGGTNRPFGQTGAAVDANGNPTLPACGGAVTTNCIASYNVFGNDPRGLGADPTMTAWFADQAAPNDYSAGDGLNTARFTFSSPRMDPQRDFVVKIDHKFSANHTIFGRYAWGKQDTIADSTNSGTPRFPGLPNVVDTTRDPKNLAVSYRAVVSPRAVNELVVGFNDFNFNFMTPEAGLAPDLITALTTDPHVYEHGNLRGVRTWQFVDNFSWTSGAHLIKTGVNLRFQRHKDERGSIGGFNANLAAVFGTGNVNTACLAGSYGAGGTTGVTATGQERFCLPATTAGSFQQINSSDRSRLQGMINDMLGRVATVRQGFVAEGDLSAWQPGGSFFLNNANYPEYDFYIQDTWKVRRNLTVDLGLRWEIKMTPRAENRLFTPDQPVGIGVTPSNTLRWIENELYASDKNNIGPSLGFAWDPWSDGKTAVRGNYRMAFDRINTFVVSSQIYNTIPGITFSASNTQFGTNGGPGGTGGRVRDGLPSLTPTSTPDVLTQPAAFGSGTNTVMDPNLRAPVTHGWGLDIQRDLGKGIMFEVSYIGRKAQNLFGAYDANEVEIFSNGFLDAFNVVKAGGDSALMNQLFLNHPSRTSTETGSQFVRRQFATALTQNSVAGIAGSAAAQTTTAGVPLVQAAGLSPFFFRAYPQFGTLRVIDSNDYSKYHALQMVVNKKTGTLQFQGSYTFSKSLDNRSYDPAFTVVSTGTVQSASSTPFSNSNRRLNYARSDFDRTHILTGYAMYDLPFGRKRRWAANVPATVDAIIGGWNINGVLRMSTGRPFTVYSGANQLSNIVSTPANCNGCSKDMGQVSFNAAGNAIYFTDDEIARFTVADPGTVGNTGRNYFTGPGLFNLDMALLKRTAMPWEGHSLELRIETFNLTNTPSWGFPSTVVTSPSSLGIIGTSSAVDSRKVRVGAKYIF